MFWKRKRTSPELFWFETDDRRASVRVPPSDKAPILFMFGGKEVRVINIGAVGLSFDNNHFAKGQTHPITLDLPGLNITVPAVLEIISIDSQHICHCKFKEISEPAVNEIHRYLLERQKEILRSKQAETPKDFFETKPEDPEKD